MQGDLFAVTPKPRRPNPVVKEIHRRETNYDRVLARLRQGPATNAELNLICFRYGARLMEMRKRGYIIQTKRQYRQPNGTPSPPGVFVYILKEQP